VEKAIDHLAQTFPLKTAEWAAWSATMRPPKLEGTWVLRATQLGKGDVYGRMVVTPVAGLPDEFTTEITYIYGRTGEKVTRTGRAVVYTGFQWRGRSSTSASPTTSASSSGTAAADVATNGAEVDTALREVMFVDRNWRTMEGRWFTGGYDEIGMDVRLERVGAETRVVGTDRTALRAGASGQEIKIFGANLPASLAPAQIDLGPGITVTRVVSVVGDTATIVVDVAKNAPAGKRDLFVAGASRPEGLAVYDSIDAIKVTPEWAMARVGGVRFPKALAQFEARAYDNGADNRPDTPDDIDLGVVNAEWSIEEFTATYDDDDIKFVGGIDKSTGLFTPAVDGPNPARRGERNNVGDVYVVASYTPDGTDAKGAKPLRARAHLLVTVPLYMRWEQPGTM
jgi:quinohemoprotein amine dehydrogenase